MWICVCNTLDEDDVNEAKENGSKDCYDVMSYHDKSFRCCRCMEDITNILKDS